MWVVFFVLVITMTLCNHASAWLMYPPKKDENEVLFARLDSLVQRLEVLERSQKDLRQHVADNNARHDRWIKEVETRTDLVFNRVDSQLGWAERKIEPGMVVRMNPDGTVEPGPKGESFFGVVERVSEERALVDVALKNYLRSPCQAYRCVACGFETAKVEICRRCCSDRREAIPQPVEQQLCLLVRYDGGQEWRCQRPYGHTGKCQP